MPSSLLWQHWYTSFDASRNAWNCLILYLIVKKNSGGEPPDPPFNTILIQIDNKPNIISFPLSTKPYNPLSVIFFFTPLFWVECILVYFPGIKITLNDIENEKLRIQQLSHRNCNQNTFRQLSLFLRKS